MELLYKSTRSADKTVTASYAILKGLAEDGGLFVPTSFPKLDVSIDRLADMSYQEVAYEVMKLFLTDFTEAACLWDWHFMGLWKSALFITHTVMRCFMRSEEREPF